AEAELGRRALLGDRQLERAAGRVVVVRVSRPRDRRHGARPDAGARRDRRGEQPTAARSAASGLPAAGATVTELVGTELAPARGPKGETLVELQELAVDYATTDRRVRAVDGVSLAIHAGEIVGL